MKRAIVFFVLITLGVVAVAAYAICSFFDIQKQDYTLKELTVCVEKVEESPVSRFGKDLYLSIEDSEAEFRIPSVWITKFDRKAFEDDFNEEKEYIAVILADDLEDFKNGDLVNLYGLRAEGKEYLSSDAVIKYEKTSAPLPIIIALVLLTAVVFVDVVIYRVLTEDRRTPYKVDKRIYKQ